MRLLATFLSFLLVAALVQADGPTPDGAIRSFYSWVLAHPSGALPSPKERTQLARVLSPELIQLLRTASDTETQCVKAAPKGDKPFIIEGDLFVGNYEGATEAAYGEPQGSGDAVAVDIDLVYVDTRFPKAHKHRAVAWKDRLELRLINGRWYVQDVSFSQDRSLVAGLKAYIEEGTRSCTKP